MTCKEVAEFSSDYLDLELPRLQRLSFRLHLLLCRDCRRFVNGVRSLLRYSQLLRVRHPDHYERLSSSLTEEPNSTD